MILPVISDIDSNLEALESMLSEPSNAKHLGPQKPPSFEGTKPKLKKNA
jgi:hypothetical protein